MPSQKFAPAIAFLKKEAEDVRNWQSTRLSVHELLRAAEEADSLLSSITSRTDVAKAEAQDAEKRRDVANREAASAEERAKANVAESARVARDLAAKKDLATRYKTLDELDLAIAEKQKALANLTTDYENFRAKVGV
jgi:hypothetical protein